MKYAIYDTNVYRHLTGRGKLTYGKIAEKIQMLREHERNAGFVPVLNTTVASEMISHLLPNDGNRELYIKACFALYEHCYELQLVTLNPGVAYIAEKLYMRSPMESYWIFLKKLHDQPTYDTLKEHEKYIETVNNVVTNIEQNLLKALQCIREQLKKEKEQQEDLKERTKSDTYPAYRAWLFLKGVVEALRQEGYNTDYNSIVNDKAIEDFIDAHPAYIEINRWFDNTYARGDFNLNKSSTANTFWDAEIFYHLNRPYLDGNIVIVTNEHKLHDIARSVGQADYVFKIDDMFKL